MNRLVDTGTQSQIKRYYRNSLSVITLIVSTSSFPMFPKRDNTSLLSIVPDLSMDCPLPEGPWLEGGGRGWVYDVRDSCSESNLKDTLSFELHFATPGCGCVEGGALLGGADFGGCLDGGFCGAIPKVWGACFWGFEVPPRAGRTNNLACGLLPVFWGFELWTLLTFTVGEGLEAVATVDTFWLVGFEGGTLDWLVDLVWGILVWLVALVGGGTLIWLVALVGSGALIWLVAPPPLNILLKNTLARPSVASPSSRCEDTSTCDQSDISAAIRSRIDFHDSSHDK